MSLLNKINQTIDTRLIPSGDDEGKSWFSSDVPTLKKRHFDEKLALQEASRCLNCDVHTVFNESTCIECSACDDICPMDCINFVEVETSPAESAEQVLEKLRVKEINPEQELLVSAPLKTGHIMIKDEDVCLHCGLCAERCPTGAWDMQKLIIDNIGATIK